MFPIARLRQHLSAEAVGTRPLSRDSPRRVVDRGGLPPGVFNAVNGDEEAVDALLHHPVAAVSFAGSTSIAHYIYRTAAESGNRV
jgi:acyl-CoA reductase-like NAD-dependent aldehyde dehydrogenase